MAEIINLADHRSGAPAVPAWQRDPTTFTMWCDDCRAYHSHGAAPGHRLAHCHDLPKRPASRSRYYDTGYVLVPVGVAPPELLADMDRRRP